MKNLSLLLLAILSLTAASGARGQELTRDFPMMELPPEVRKWYRNPDGSCVQCSLGMCGAWNNVPAATTLLWDTEYGPAERGGSYPSRVAKYSERRKIPIYNVTGRDTWDWMDWACKTGRFAAIGAGGSHFQTLVGHDPKNDRYYVCNNNSTHKIDEYSEEGFRRLHLASGQWVVILDVPAPPPIPVYVRWWGNREWKLSTPDNAIREASERELFPWSIR